MLSPLSPVSYTHLFAQELVHPEDRALVIKLTDSYMEAFFENGLNRCNYRFRIYNRITGQYRWCQVTLLRVDSGNPYQHSVLLVWQTETEAAAPLKMMDQA